MVRRLPAHLLRRHVAYRTEDGSRLGPTDFQISDRRRAVRRPAHRLDQAREAEVEDLELPVAGDEEVLRLQVAVDDPFLVRRGQPQGHLQAVLDGFPRRQRLSRLQLVAERLPLQQLRDEIRKLRVLADVVDGDDVGMAEHAGRARLDLESADEIAVAGERFGEHLDRYVSPQPRVAGAIHDAHRSRAELTDDLVGPESLA